MAEGSFHSIKYIFAKCHACMSKNRNILGICLFKSKSTFWKTIFRQISYSPSKTHLQALHCRLPILKKLSSYLSIKVPPSGLERHPFLYLKFSPPQLETFPTRTGKTPSIWSGNFLIWTMKSLTWILSLSFSVRMDSGKQFSRLLLFHRS